MKKQKDSSDTIVSRLQKRKSDLEVQVSSSKEQNKQLEKSLGGLKSLTRSDNLYKVLTGITVTPSLSYENQYLCLATTHSTNLSFNLLMDDAPGEVEYTPSRVEFNPKASALPKLPDYLTESIVFASDKCPAFLSKLLNAIHA
jgi:hypothetical protein